MKILTFDTSLNKTYITYGENENIIVSKAICSTDEKYHSAYLIPEIINILKNQSVTMQDIDAIGINEGPGSFTGIRICTVIARVAAQHSDIKVVAVPSLQILSKINTTEKNSIVVLDARKNKAYIAIYNKEGKELTEPCAISYEELYEKIKIEDFEVISDSAMNEKFKDKNIKSTNYEENDYPLGEYLYKITLKKLSEENDYHWAKVKPLYIQPPSITLPKKVGN